MFYTHGQCDVAEQEGDGGEREHAGIPSKDHQTQRQKQNQGGASRLYDGSKWLERQQVSRKQMQCRYREIQVQKHQKIKFVLFYTTL